MGQVVAVCGMPGSGKGEFAAVLSDAGVTARRMPFQVDASLRQRINAGEVMFLDQHLSETVEMLRNKQIAPVDIAVMSMILFAISRSHSARTCLPLNSSSKALRRASSVAALLFLFSRSENALLKQRVELARLAVATCPWSRQH